MKGSVRIPPVSCRTFDEAEGNLVLEEQLNNLVGIATMQRELDARILDQESCDESRKDLLGDCRGNPCGRAFRQLALPCVVRET